MTRNTNHPSMILFALATLMAAPASAQLEESHLWDATYEPGDGFGTAVAVRGDVIVAAMPYKDVKNSQGQQQKNAGAVQLIRRVGSQWGYNGHIKADDPQAGDLFGTAVALGDKNNVLVVGAPRRNVSAVENSGAAYVVRLGEDWGIVGQPQYLYPLGNAQPGSEFGSAVAVDGDWIAIGAGSLDTSKGDDAGVVFLYSLSSGYAFPAGSVVPDDASAGAAFGHAVDVSGDLMLIGAPMADQLSGCAYVFRRDSFTSEWKQEAKLVAPDGLTGGHVGWSVALDGDVALVGAPDNDAAYVFARQGGVWNPVRILKPEGLTSIGYFGQSVALDGDVALVGAPLLDGAGDNTGAAYVYRSLGAMWILEETLVGTQVAAQDQFGGRVAVGGDTAVVSASLDDWYDGEDAGSAYVYDGLTTEAAALEFGEGCYGAGLFTNDAPELGKVITLNAVSTNLQSLPEQVLLYYSPTTTEYVSGNGCTLYLGNPLFLAVTSNLYPVFSNGVGVSIPAQISDDASLVGFTVNLQGVMLKGSGLFSEITMTNGLHLRLGH